jgi:hypothetical protein
MDGKPVSANGGDMFKRKQFVAIFHDCKTASRLARRMKSALISALRNSSGRKKFCIHDASP